MTKVLKACRTCLKFVYEENYSKINSPENSTIAEMLSNCVSEIDMNLVNDPVICEFCLSALSLSYEFRVRCKNTEERLKKFVEINKITTKSIELTLIVNENMKKTNKTTAKYDYVNNLPSEEIVIYANKEIEGSTLKDSESTEENVLCDYLAQITSTNSMMHRRTKPLYKLSKYKVYKDKECSNSASNNEFVNDHDYTIQNSEGTSTEQSNVIISTDSAAQNTIDCPLCDTKYKDTEDLNEHLKNNHDNISYKCRECKIGFSTYGKYKAHTNLHKNETYKCLICSELFFKRTDLITHTRSIHGYRRIDKFASNKRKLVNLDLLQCSYCLARYASHEDFDEHLKMHTSELCEKCGKTFTTQYSLRKHLQTHNKDRNSVCKYCGKAFKYYSLLYQHEKRHATRPKFKCGKCLRMFYLESQLRYHEVSHTNNRQFQCSYCPRAFKYKATMTAHVNLRHLKAKQYRCQYCEEVFGRSDYLKNHLRKKHEIGDITRFACEDCDKIFTTKNNLCNHIASVHGQTRPFACQECSRSYATKSLLQHHTKVMHGEKVQCEICLKWLRNKFSLKVHVSKHGGSTPYQCDFCGQRFADLGNRNRHRKIHEKDGVMCMDCYKRFDSVEQLEEHRKGHDKKRYKCHLCGEEFSRNFALVNHQRLHEEEDREVEIHLVDDELHTEEDVILQEMFISDQDVDMHQVPVVFQDNS